MPTYNYKCSNCGHEFEQFLSMKDNDKPTHEPCIKCNQLTIKQIIIQSSLVTEINVEQKYKQPEDWKAFLRHIKRKNPGSNINV
jgi:putative FmdB family regulatory protein